MRAWSLSTNAWAIARQQTIEKETLFVSEGGAIDCHGNWTSKEEEVKRLKRLQGDIAYFLREYP